MTRPCRRITLHLSQIGLTLGFTFTAVRSFGVSGATDGAVRGAGFRLCVTGGCYL